MQEGRSEGEACSALANLRFKRHVRKKMQRYSGRGRTENSRQVTQGKERPALSQDIHTVIVDCGGDC